MKKSILILGLLATVSVYSQGITKSLKQKATQVNYNSLIGKDMKTVMSDLKLTAKDTIGKTTSAVFPQVDKTKKLTGMTLKDGTNLIFDQSNLKAVLPASVKNPF